MNIDYELLKRLPSISGKSKSELLDLLLREEYGYFPDLAIDVGVSSSIEDENFGGGKAVLERLSFNCRSEFGEHSFDVSFVYPKHKKSNPCFLHLNFGAELPHKYQPTEALIDAGYAVLSVFYKSVSSDDGDFTDGLAGIIYKNGERSDSDCGKIGIWAWALSRIMDHAEGRDEIDARRVSVVGHSRLGKTALLAGALDDRFECAISNDSGCSGAAIARGNRGETVSDICRVFPFWFCKNYYKYAGREDDMPFDQHFLIAANVGHKVYIASAEEDAWAYPPNEYLCAVAASEYYVANGKRGLCGEASEIPFALHEGDVGYHIRRGTHYLNGEDWKRYIEYLGREKI